MSEVLLYKKIGSLNTEQPILFFSERDYKSAFLLGEGLWRWRLNDTYLNNNNVLFNSFISKIVQYLLADEDKSRLRITYNPVQISGQRIFFEAELYNKNFELTNSYDINMEIVDSLGNHFNYKFIPIDNRYYLDVGLLLDGKYTFVAETKMGNESLSKHGIIVVSDFSLELRDLVADYNLLSDLASKNNGKIILKEDLNELIDSITSSENFKPITYYNYYFQPLINFQSLLILVLILLFLEWFIRRRYINY